MPTYLVDPPQPTWDTHTLEADSEAEAERICEEHGWTLVGEFVMAGAGDDADHAMAQAMCDAHGGAT